MADKTIRKMTAIERDIVEPLKLNRLRCLQQLAIQQEQLAVIESTLTSMAALMHGKNSADLGIDLDTYTLYQTTKKKKQKK